MKPRRNQDGFTVVEVVVATALLLVGVLGTMLMVDVASRHTAAAKSRAAGNNLARRLVEVARTVPLGNLTTAGGPAAIQVKAPDLADANPADAAWTIERDGREYIVEFTGCQVDDPADGTSGPSARTSDFCSQPPASTPADATPADARRVSVTVAWAQPGGSGRARAVAVLPVTLGDLPRVASLELTAPTACVGACVISEDVATARLKATASPAAGGMAWLLDGALLAKCPPATGQCSGSDTAWTLDWTLGATVKDTTTGSVNAGKCVAGPYRLDGTYNVGARASDPFDRAQQPVSMAITLNRCPALAPKGAVATGREQNTPVIDIGWQAGAEGDLLGHRVYKGPTPATAITPVCPADAGTGGVLPLAVTQCVDPAPPAYTATPYHYVVKGVDRDPSGNIREGALAWSNVNSGNRAPTTPAMSGPQTRDAAGVRFEWNSSSDADAGDRIVAYRIYRRANGTTAPAAPGIADRLLYEASVTLCVSGCSFTDTAPPAGPLNYWVTAVDSYMRESGFSAARYVP